MRGPLHPLTAIAEARGHLFPFVPVLLAIGIGGYFVAPREPQAMEWAGLGLLALLGFALWLRGPERWQPVVLAVALVCAGAGIAGLRAHAVAEPVLGWRYYGAIEGRIVAIDRSQSDALRLTLDQVVLERISPGRMPTRVRVALHGQQGFILPEPGMRVILTGHLSPPGGPVEPGGFSFRRMAWFQGLGAVGYTRTPVLALAPAEEGRAGLAVERLRMRISAAVRARVPGEPGGFAAAILTGDRSGVGRATLEDLRGSNLAHLLAISGLHMGLLTGFVFAALRLGFAMIPPLALRLPTRKLAALGALAAAAFYLLLSGGNVATERAFIMVAVMLGAVLLDRRAISLRSVGMAAVVILCLRPESLTQPGFQMSFAATVALVAAFGVLRYAPEFRKRFPRWLHPALSLVIASLVAGLATAPVAAAHFNRIAEYGLLANLLTVPLMGTVVIPAAVMAGVLAPFGASGLALAVMELGTKWILAVAAWVASLDGAVVPVVQPQPFVLPVMALGGIWAVLWPGRARVVGVAAAAVALVLWPLADRPAVLVAESGTLVGVLGPQGRVLSKATGERFISENWLAADGDAALPEEAAARPGLQGTPGARHFMLAGQGIVHLTGRGAAEQVASHCAAGRWVILGARAAVSPDGCVVIDQTALAQSGSLALVPGIDGVMIRRANDREGRRLWSRPETPRRQ